MVNQTLHNCPECKKELVIRTGKFGEFICCPSGHGTFSIQNGVMYFKGVVGQMLKQNRIEEVYQQLSLQYIESGVRSQPSLSQLMNAQLAAWGWDSSNELNQLADYAVGNPTEMWDDDERNNPSAWWNQRPY